MTDPAAGAVSVGAGAVSEAAGAVSEAAGAVSEAAGAVSEAAGAALGRPLGGWFGVGMLGRFMMRAS
jgi:hypothetical protein